MLMRTERGQYGTPLFGAADWKVARWLERNGLASIEGDPGQVPEALLWATEEGTRILAEFDDEEDGDECPYCGLSREHTHVF
jgi:hypothetical protein